MYNKKYRLVKFEEFGRHNSLYDNMLGQVCYPVYFNVGERGWFLYDNDIWFEPLHRVHTTTIKEVTYMNDNQIIVTTQNTRFTFALISGGKE